MPQSAGRREWRDLAEAACIPSSWISDHRPADELKMDFGEFLVDGQILVLVVA